MGLLDKIKDKISKKLPSGSFPNTIYSALKDFAELRHPSLDSLVIELNGVDLTATGLSITTRIVPDLKLNVPTSLNIKESMVVSNIAATYIDIHSLQPTTLNLSVSRPVEDGHDPMFNKFVFHPMESELVNGVCFLPPLAQVKYTIDLDVHWARIDLEHRIKIYNTQHSEDEMNIKFHATASPQNVILRGILSGR